MSLLDFDRLATEVEEKLLALPRAKRSGGELVFSCPLSDRHANGDAHPSASYSIAKRAWRCKGCTASGGLVKGDHPIAALLGLELGAYRAASAHEPQRASRPDRSWEIRARDGQVVANHHRRDLGGGRKKVWWERDDLHSLGGFPVADLPLYGVDLLGEREPGDDSPVVVCEGEPATDALLELGLRAVGTVTGASTVPNPGPLDDLRGADVVLWPDADDVGLAHMLQIAARLEGVAGSVRIFSPDLAEHEDAADWVRTHPDHPNLATALLGEIEELARPAPSQRPKFSPLSEDSGYQLEIPALATSLEVTHLRRERHQLRGEILARCALPGASTFDGVLSVHDLNFSSARSRKDLAGHLAEQSKTPASGWQNAVEEFAQRVLAAERDGAPDVSLPEVELVETRTVEVAGVKYPALHPSILFGDGDSGKSYLALHTLGSLAAQGLRVGLADWELDGADHRERLGRLFPGTMPDVRYLRCERPIGLEAERLRRWVRDRGLDFVAFDSVAYACAGAPESAEVAMQYFQVVRQLGARGTLHIAHVTKAQEGADRRPFGSAFWHNSPRATWFCKLAERDPGGTISRLGLFPRKWNLGPLPSAVGLELVFGRDRTIVRPAEVIDSPELAATLSVRHRMIAALRAGPLSPKELAEEIEAPADTVRKTVSRHSDTFKATDGVISLVERRHEN